MNTVIWRARRSYYLPTLELRAASGCENYLSTFIALRAARLYLPEFWTWRGVRTLGAADSKVTAMCKAKAE